MKRISVFTAAITFFTVICSGSAWACSIIFEPYKPSLLMLSIAILLCINYYLLYNKRYFVVEGAMVIVLGTSFLYNNPYIRPLHVIASVVMLLIFATVRLLRRHDLPEILTVKRFPLAICFIVVTALWFFTACSRPILVTNCVTGTFPLKDMGTALEMYAEYHKGKYPLELQETVPEYIKEIPRLAPYLNEKDRAFYEKTYDLQLTIQYQVNSTRDSYTMTLKPWPHVSKENSVGKYYYEPKNGLHT